MWSDRTLVSSQPRPQQSGTRSSLPIKNQSVVSWQVAGVALVRCRIRRSKLSSTLIQYRWRLLEDRGKKSQLVGYSTWAKLLRYHTLPILKCSPLLWPKIMGSQLGAWWWTNKVSSPRLSRQLRCLLNEMMLRLTNSQQWWKACCSNRPSLKTRWRLKKSRFRNLKIIKTRSHPLWAQNSEQ